MKKHNKFAIEETTKHSEIGIKKITLRDLDTPELEKVAGGVTEPTTTVQPTFHASCTTFCAGVR